MNECDSFIVESCRKNFLSKGIDLSCEQILNKIKSLNSSINSDFFLLWNFYSKDPPPPPYNYLFEMKEDALKFANKANLKYSIECKVSSSNGFWELKYD